MGSKYTIEDIDRLLRQKFGDTVYMDHSTYTTPDKSACFVDVDYGVWWQTPRRVAMEGKKHKKRAYAEHYLKYSLTIEDVKSKLVILFGDTIKIDEKTYISSNRIAGFLDKDYGEWFSLPRNVLLGKGLHAERTKLKTKVTLMEKYGVSHHLKRKDFLDKMILTTRSKYGCDNISQNQDIKDKKVKTYIDHFGVTSPLKNKKVMEKMIHTNMLRYGVSHHSQSHDVALRTARGANNSCILRHWKTNEELVCVGSYEVKTINFLNKNHVEYSWQPKVFKMPTDESGKIKTYRPDLYLDDGQLWVEIKGYFRKDAQDKWDWFHSTHKNSELWDELMLKDLGIL